MTVQLPELKKPTVEQFQEITQDNASPALWEATRRLEELINNQEIGLDADFQEIDPIEWAIQFFDLAKEFIALCEKEGFAPIIETYTLNRKFELFWIRPYGNYFKHERI